MDGRKPELLPLVTIDKLEVGLHMDGRKPELLPLVTIDKLEVGLHMDGRKLGFFRAKIYRVENTIHENGYGNKYVFTAIRIT